MFNFWWLAKQSEQKTSTKMQKNEKGPLSHWKIKCSFLDYVQLLMIGQAIWAKNVDRNAKKQKRPPKSSKNKMFIFGLCSTSDDWPSKKSKCKKTKEEQKIKKNWWSTDQTIKKWKRPPKSSKNKMFIFGLHSTSDDWPSNASKKCWQKNDQIKKMKKAP